MNRQKDIERVATRINDQAENLMVEYGTKGWEENWASAANLKRQAAELFKSIGEFEAAHECRFSAAKLEGK